MSDNEANDEHAGTDDSDAPPDAVALFHPADREALVPFLDLDEGEEASDGIYAEELEDGSFLLYTFQPYAMFEHPELASTWLAQFGDALDDVHDDPRGFLFFPGDLEPEATTYEGVVAEIGEAGAWIVPTPGIDMEALQAFASQLIGPDGKMPAGSFAMGQLLEGLPGKLAEVFGVEPPPSSKDPEDPDKP